MTLEETMEMDRLERDTAQLQRAITNPNMAASATRTPEHKAAMERIARNRMRLAELKTK